MNSNSSTKGKPRLEPLADIKVSILLGLSGVFSFNTGLRRPIFALFANSLGVLPVFIGLFETIGIVVNALTRPLWGKLSDVRGRRGPILIGLAITGMGSVLLTLTQDVWLFFIDAVLVGVGAASFWPSVKAALADHYHRQHEKAFAYTTATQASTQALGAALGGGFATWTSYRGVFGLGALLIFGALVVGSFRIRPEPQSTQTATPNKPTISPTAQAEPKQRWWQVGGRVAWLLGIAFGVMGLGFGVPGPFLALYLNEVFGVDPLWIGLIFTGFSSALVLGSLVTPQLAKWFDKRLPRPVSLGLALVMVTATYASLPLAPLPVFLLLMTTAFLLQSFLRPILLAMVTERFPQQIGTVIGLFESVNMGASALGPIWGGLVYSISPTWLFPVSGLIILGSALVFFLAAIQLSVLPELKR